MLLVVALLFFAVDGTASEPDNFTDRPTDPKELADASALGMLNDKTNELLQTALTGVKGCDLRALHRSIQSTLAGGEVGKLEWWAMENPQLKKVVVAYDKSIYAKTGFRTGSMGLFLLGIVPSLTLNGHYVGADKLGHFFDQGYDYYEAIYVKHDDPFLSIENLGLTDEDGLNGMQGNGIRSYGDMAANFSGYLFWRQVVGGDNPYYKCEDGRYARTSRKFDWAEYANDAWDEGLNCSEFTPAVEKAVKERLKALGTSCPIDRSSCQKIVDLPCGATFLSPKCLPYVTRPTYPDAACRHLIEVDESETQACYYSAGFDRIDEVKTTHDLLDGAATIKKLRGQQAHDWIQRKELELLRRYLPALTHGY